MLTYAYFFPKYDLMGHLQTDSSSLLQLSVQKLNTRLTALKDQIRSFILFKRNTSCGVETLIQSFIKLKLLRICL